MNLKQKNFFFFYLIFTFDSQLHWKIIRVNLINSVQNEASINPKATLLLNDTIFFLASSFSWKFLCFKVFLSAVLAWGVLSVFLLSDSPVQLLCRLVPNHPPSPPQPSSLHIRKMSLLVKQSMNFHMTSGLCVSTIRQKNHLYYCNVASPLAGYLYAWGTPTWRIATVVKLWVMWVKTENIKKCIRAKTIWNLSFIMITNFRYVDGVAQKCTSKF